MQTVTMNYKKGLIRLFVVASAITFLVPTYLHPASSLNWYLSPSLYDELAQRALKELKKEPCNIGVLSMQREDGAEYPLVFIHTFKPVDGKWREIEKVNDSCGALVGYGYALGEDFFYKNKTLEVSSINPSEMKTVTNRAYYRQTFNFLKEKSEAGFIALGYLWAFIVCAGLIGYFLFWIYKGFKS